MAVDLRALMLPLLPARVGVGGYSEVDRYRDFRAVFFGTPTTEQQERVLFQILAVAEIHHVNYGLDARETERWVGRRDVGMAVLEYLTREPRTNTFVHKTENENDGRSEG